MWWITQVIGCLMVTAMNSLYRARGASVSVVLITAVPWATVGWLFSISYSSAPKMLQPWFLANATLALSGTLVSILLFGEPMQTRHAVGAILAITAGYLLIT